MKRTENQKKVAKLVVDEINSIDKINSFLELGMRLSEKLDPSVVGAFGLGCGNNCDSWGLGCGNNCLNGLDPSEEVIKYRYAIDVLGKKDLSSTDMKLMQKDFKSFKDTIVEEVKTRFDFKGMQDRINKYS